MPRAKKYWDTPEAMEEARVALGAMVPDRIFRAGTPDEIVGATTDAASQLVREGVQRKLKERAAAMSREAPVCPNSGCSRREKNSTGR
jgi:hypothetical protein